MAKESHRIPKVRYLVSYVRVYTGIPDILADVFYDFPLSFKAIPSIVLQMGHSRFLSNLFQFLIQLSFYHLTLYGIATDSIVK
jgi:hypothetical protein